MHCQSCSNLICVKTEVFTKCQGKCAKAFHAHCVGLAENTMQALQCRNVIWLCDDCLIVFGATRYQESKQCLDESTEIMKEVKDLKSQVAEINKVLSESLQKPLDAELESLYLRKSSTPVSSPKPLEATVSSNNRHCDNSCHSSRRRNYSSRDQSFSLLLSNVHNRVTEHDISLLVSKSLGLTDLDDCKVTKLVSKWKACEEMDYISFKVVLDVKWKSTAMCDTTWPRQILYREFIRHHNDTWYPTIWGSQF